MSSKIKKKEIGKLKKTTFLGRNKSTINLIVNSSLSILTLIMVLITYNANRISNNSIDVAEKSLGQAARANDIAEKSFLLNYNNSKNSDSINKKTLELTEKSIIAQINSLNQSQKQFEKQNKPFLQLRDFKLIDFDKNKKIEIFYWLQNLGNYPARIIERKYGYFIDTNIPPADPYEKITNLTPDKFDEYITKESPLSQKFTSQNNLSEFYFKNLTNKNLYLYLFGDLIYVNESNNKKRECQFYVKIFPPPSIEYKIIYIKNFDIE